jgi:hypothetical protein
MYFNTKELSKKFHSEKNILIRKIIPVVFNCEIDDIDIIDFSISEIIIKFILIFCFIYILKFYIYYKNKNRRDNLKIDIYF